MTSMDIRTIFMGSPEFALPVLRILVDHTSVVGVVTQPDKPAGRGQNLTPPPVKVLAQQLGLSYIQPRRLKDPGVFEQLVDWRPDLIVVAAFGQILRTNVLDLPVYGCLNVHASLLPRWRGAAPIQAAILHGDKSSGATLMRMDTGIDTGQILAQNEVPILPMDTSVTLGNKIAIQGAKLLADVLSDYISGNLPGTEQDESKATYASRIEKGDGLLDFHKPAQDLERAVRAYTPWPGTFTYWLAQPFKILKAHVILEPLGLKPGEAGAIAGTPAVGTISGNLILDEVQPAGKKSMPGQVFLRGAKSWSGVILGSDK